MADSRKSSTVCAGGGGAVYGLGLIGALVFYWQQADGFWGHVWGVIEGLLWPAFLVYEALSKLAA